ncbi:MAG TPA: hypothetical protein VG722_11500 [Tepidisphaeraceae bacterium]|nr:hypothetical protein [Tepidisphaeraceae bacterium]
MLVVLLVKKIIATPLIFSILLLLGALFHFYCQRPGVKVNMAEESIISCPSCGKRLKLPPNLAGKTAKCPCGQSIPIAASGGMAVAPPLAYRRTSEASANDEQSTVIKQAILFAVLLLVLIGAIYGLRHLKSSSAITAPSLGDDAHIQKMIDEENGTEAREWLDQVPGRMLSGMTISQAKRQIDNWYNMGAAKVYAFGGMMTLSVAIELPKDPAKRQALFAWVNNWNAKQFVKRVSDVGQKYLLVHLGI